ncbi:MAG: hypothetical protein KF846_09820 [Cyclobacteriaceae bacterium]|nr:hypothetical protein [Cyclobacteriaceae bacterium]MBX2956444.1 hypothetical protein [Cyclobacteriaceae bacterium]
MRAFVISLLVVVGVGTTWAQGENNSLKDVPFKERVFTGGGFGMGFNNFQDYVSVSPVIGYSFTRKFMGGVGLSYQFVKYKNVLPGKDVNANNYGINPFLRFNVIQGFFLQTEFEHLNYEFINYPPLETTREAFNSFLGGGGYIQPIGRNAAFFAMVLYNFNFQTPAPGEYAPYYNPWILRVGVNVGGFIF